MSSRRRNNVPEKKRGGTGSPLPYHEPARSGHGTMPRVHSRELLRDGEQLIIEHAGREYRLRVTSNGKLILTA